MASAAPAKAAARPVATPAPVAPPPVRCIFAEAVERMHASRQPHELPCRDAEVAAVRGFLHGCLEGTGGAGNGGGSLYIAGSPGVGKTAVVVRGRKGAA